MLSFILQQFYKYTFCRDIKHCIGLCGIKWTTEQKDKLLRDSYKII